MSRQKMNQAHRRRGFNISLSPVLVERVMALTLPDSKDRELLNRSRSAAIEILIQRGLDREGK